MLLVNRHTGEQLRLRRIERRGEVWLELKGSLPAQRSGPPLHIHFFEDESRHVTSGKLTVLIDKHQVTVAAGSSTAIPRGVPHRWWNAGSQTLEFEGTVRPVVDLDRFLQALFEIVNAGPADNPPMFYVAHAALRHRDTQLVFIFPRAIQGVLFRAIVAVGTMLGKYKGTDWPGCPERCVGAPLGAEEEH